MWHAIDQANEKFIPMCVGITGKIGELVIDVDHVANKENLPIDMFVLDITDGMFVDEEVVNDDINEAVDVDADIGNSQENLTIDCNI